MKLTGLKSGTPVQRFHNAFVICQACSHMMTEEGPWYIRFSFFSFSRANSAVFIEQVYQDLLCGQKITPKDLLFYFLLLTIVWTPLKTQVFSVLWLHCCINSQKTSSLLQEGKSYNRIWFILPTLAVFYIVCVCFIQIDTLMSLLTKLRKEDHSVKSLVISQFTSLLNIVETPLKAEGFNFVRLDGKMSQKKRSEVIELFDDRGPDSPKVMLLSLKAGGVGLNLTAASRVFLLDPVCWSF